MRIDMKWLETIKVQTATGFETAMEKELKVLMKDLLTKTRGSGLEEAHIYNHASVTGYFAIYLTWKTEVPQTTGSLIGLNLSQAYKAFGLVDHSVWIQRE
jgi:hypothetical protein